MEELASPEFGAGWSTVDSGYLSPNRQFDLDLLTDDTQRRLTELVHEALDAGLFRYDASNLMPGPVQGHFMGLLEDFFIDGPEGAAALMQEVEATWLEPEASG